MASARRARLASLRIPEEEMRRKALDASPGIPIRLSPEGFDVIAEVKRRAPGQRGHDSPNETDPGLPARLARAYSRAGAVAVSVLTEPLAFGGGLSDLKAVAETLRSENTGPPVMRKDFLVHPYQVYEARVGGADGVLLIADMLEPAVIERMMDAVEETAQWILVEAFDDDQFDLAVRMARDAGSRGLTALAGVNARNLRTLAVDAERFNRLSGRLPTDVPTVAESGITSPDQAAVAAGLGYRLGLVGSALVGAEEPADLLAAMIERGRLAGGDA